MIHSCQHCHKPISSKQSTCPYCKTMNEKGAHAARARSNAFTALFATPLLSRK